jgi:hypothetical protein
VGREILTFALQWRHWGGGDAEDIFVHFGLSPTRYFLRVRRLLSTPAARNLSPDEKADLRRLCAIRVNNAGKLCSVADRAAALGH